MDRQVPIYQQDLINEFGRFGMLAHSVASQVFRHNPASTSTTVASVRIPDDLELRLKAMAGIAGVSTNRLVNEVLTNAMDELEEALFKERDDAYANFINLYESLLLEYQEMLALKMED